MLQYLTSHSDTYTPARQAEMVINGGCNWIELRADNVTPDDRGEAMRAAAPDLISVCKEFDAYLIINGDPELALELECHGVHLNADSKESPREVREKLGPAAIIGVTVSGADEIIALRSADIDYVRLETPDIAEIAAIVKTVRDAGESIPITASAEITLHRIPELLEAGVNGVAASDTILYAANPVQYTADLVAALGRDA